MASIGTISEKDFSIDFLFPLPSLCYITLMDRDSKTLGIILKRENRGERNSSLTILTPDNGLITVTAYGSGRGAKSYRAPLYGEGVFSIERKNEYSISLKDTEILSEHEWVKDSVEKIAWVSLFSELVIKARTTGSEMYSLYTSTLDNINDDNIERVAVYFLSHFLKQEGLSSDWETCPMCGKRYDEDEVLGFSTLSSSAVCSACDTLSSSLILPPNARRYILRVSQSNIRDSLSFSISDSFVRRISRYLMHSLVYVFPSKLMTLSSGLIS